MLIRVVRLPDGSLATGRGLVGRGAWLCAESPGCLDLAERHGAFERALRAPVAPGSVEVLRRRLGDPSHGGAASRGRGEGGGVGGAEADDVRT